MRINKQSAHAIMYPFEDTSLHYDEEGGAYIYNYDGSLVLCIYEAEYGEDFWWSVFDANTYTVLDNMKFGLAGQPTLEKAIQDFLKKSIYADEFDIQQRAASRKSAFRLTPDMIDWALWNQDGGTYSLGEVENGAYFEFAIDDYTERDDSGFDAYNVSWSIFWDDGSVVMSQSDSIEEMIDEANFFLDVDDKAAMLKKADMDPCSNVVYIDLGSDKFPILDIPPLSAFTDYLGKGRTWSNGEVECVIARGGASVRYPVQSGYYAYVYDISGAQDVKILKTEAFDTREEAYARLVEIAGMYGVDEVMQIDRAAGRKRMADFRAEFVPHWDMDYYAIKYKIYQVRDSLLDYLAESDEHHPYVFMRWDFAKTHGFDFGDYWLAYEGEIRYVSEFENESKILEHIFEKFNMNHPSDFYGRSLSVSDIVEINGRYFYCDSFGFTEIDPYAHTASRKTAEVPDMAINFPNPYQLLGRLQADCEYVINSCGGERNLWAKDWQEHIETMRYLYDKCERFEGYPEWISEADIDAYEDAFRERFAFSNGRYASRKTAEYDWRNSVDGYYDIWNSLSEDFWTEIDGAYLMLVDDDIFSIEQGLHGEWELSVYNEGRLRATYARDCDSPQDAVDMANQSVNWGGSFRLPKLGKRFNTKLSEISISLMDGTNNLYEGVDDDGNLVWFEDSGYGGVEWYWSVMDPNTYMPIKKSDYYSSSLDEAIDDYTLATGQAVRIALRKAAEYTIQEIINEYKYYTGETISKAEAEEIAVYVNEYGQDIGEVINEWVMLGSKQASRKTAREWVTSDDVVHEDSRWNPNWGHLRDSEIIIPDELRKYCTKAKVRDFGDYYGLYICDGEGRWGRLSESCGFGYLIDALNEYFNKCLNGDIGGVDNPLTLADWPFYGSHGATAMGRKEAAFYWPKTADSFVDNEVAKSVEMYIRNNDLDPYGYPSDYDAVVDWATKQYELHGKPNTPSKHINDIVEDVLFMVDEHTASNKNATRHFTYAEMQELDDEIEGRELHNANRLRYTTDCELM